MRTALAITHVAFEDLGSLGSELENAGFRIDMIDACTADLKVTSALAADLVIVLGGPIGVYERAAYPFLQAEIEVLRSRLAERRPTIGICLGAQLLAAALGARVYPGKAGKELGWAPVYEGANAGVLPWFGALLVSDLRVLHWHGDTFDLPTGAMHLARTPHYANQAFAVGNYALALQFHPEVTKQGLERWYVGHACELSQMGIDVRQLREDSRAFGPTLESAARQVWRQWLDLAFNARTMGEATEMISTWNIGGRFWLEQASAFFGRGRIELLEKIRVFGSINEAAKSMKMGYKAAWDTVDAINRLACRPVVIRVKGGRAGGGTRITPFGSMLIEAYRGMEHEHDEFLNVLGAKYAARFKPLVGHINSE